MHGSGESVSVIVKLALVGALTVRRTAVVRVLPPEAPEIVKVEVPKGVAAVVLIVSVEACALELLMTSVDGLKLKVAPAGKPVRLRLIVPVKPLEGDTTTE